MIQHIESLGYRGIPIPGALRTAVCIVGNQGFVEDSQLLSLEGVKETLRVTKPYKLVSRETHPQSTIITLGEVTIGGSKPVIMAGPCAVESEEQALTIARIVKQYGAQIFRGGAYKPRTSPYSFQGLGEEGLKILAKVREETGLLIVTEATDITNIETGRTIYRYHSDRRPEHAKLCSSEAGRSDFQTDPPEARICRHHRRTVDVGGIYHVRRQQPDYSLRTGNPHLCR